jgi:D-alanyl-D-alanine endopeptidase (penicillin-binding protein 7)
MSKLLTAIVATDTLSPTTTVLITAQAGLAPPDQSGISAGERYEAQELLYPLLLDSSNIAAEALSYTGNRTTFLELMSSYAWEVGMPATFFADPSGVDPHNASSAHDFFALARYLYLYRPDILALTRTVSIGVPATADHAAHQFRSIHPFVNDSRFIGGKTGRTPEAGETMLTLLTINGQTVAFVVIGSQIDHRASDTSLLIEKVKGLVK